MQYNFVVSPSNPKSATFVYDETERVTKFESSNGDPIHLRFNQGELKLNAAVGKINDYDKLIVTDGSGNVLNVDHWVIMQWKCWYFRFTFVSNDGVLEYYIKQCNSSTSNLNPINVTATVLSNGCTPPDVEFKVF